ncbi:HXXEE domain-containing protein [Paenibacillus sp. 32352]|uniref:HXXEE domain-containing protein n=1 Tax=Paenibacillus sp. 32352 TaxID=1969111 RepID=UPI0009AE4A4D|nr:HXXEE domain-containing protein [Paenibacillus sp. 32352]
MSLVMFVIHDLEEIIWVEPVIKKHRKTILSRLPNGLKTKAEPMLDITSSQFAVAVWIEFIPLTFVIYLAAERGEYLGYLAFITIFFIHVFTHLGQSLLLRIYTPGVVSAVLVVLPFTSYVLYRMTNESLVSWNEVFVSIPFGLILIPIVLAGHKIGKKLVASG